MELKQNQQIMKNQLKDLEIKIGYIEMGEVMVFFRENSESRPTGAIKL
jgi:hypothetical protein